MKTSHAVVFVLSMLLYFPLYAQQDSQKVKSLGEYSKAEIGKSNPALPTVTVMAEVNVNHNFQSGIAIAIPRSATIVDIQYWCKEGEDALGNKYLMAAKGDPSHGCPYQYGHWGEATRWQEIDPATDAVQAVFVNEHSSVVRRARLVVVYQ